jgi:IPT/TIG domain
MKTVSVLLLAILAIGCGGYSTPKSAPPQAGIVPAIAAIVPNTANHGDPGFTLTVNGTTFNTNAVVNWNGVAQTNTARPATNQLTVAVPASAIATAGNVTVTVTNPGSSTPGGPYGGGGTTKSETSNSMTFTIN